MRKLMLYLFIFNGVIIFSCHQFDNPLDPTVSDAPSLFYKFFRDSVSVETELFINDSLVFVKSPLFIQYGVEDDRDTDVTIDLKIYNLQDSLVGFDQFFTAPDSLSTLYYFVVPDTNDAVEYITEFGAVDQFGNTRIDTIRFKIDNIIPYVTDKPDSTHIHIIDYTVEVGFNEIISNWSVILNNVFLFDNEELHTDQGTFTCTFPEDYGSNEIILIFYDLVYNEGTDTLNFIYCLEFDYTVEPGNAYINTDTINIVFTTKLDSIYLTINNEIVSDYTLSSDSTAINFSHDFINAENYELFGSFKDIWGQNLEFTHTFTFDDIYPSVISETDYGHIHEYNDSTEVIFNESIDYWSVIYEDNFWINEDELDNNIVTFNCMFEDGDFGFKDVLLLFYDYANNEGSDTLNFIYCPEFDYTVEPGNEYINTDTINIIFTTRLDSIYFTINDEIVSDYELSSDSTAINFSYDFNNEEYELFGSFKDIWGQNLEFTHTFTFDNEIPYIDSYVCPDTTNNENQDISIEFNEEIALWSVWEDDELLIDNQQINSCSGIFECDFDESDFGENIISFEFSDLAGNTNTDSISIYYYPAFELTNSEGLLESFYTDSNSLEVVLEFTNILNSAQLSVDDGTGYVEIYSEFNDNNCSFNYVFEDQGFYYFQGIFTDEWGQNITEEDTIYYDISTLISDMLPQDGDTIYIDSLSCTITFNENISYYLIEETSALGAFIYPDSVEGINYDTIEFYIIFNYDPVDIQQYQFQIGVRDTDLENPEPLKVLTFSYWHISEEN